MAMNDDNSPLDFIMREGAMILLGVLLVSFAGFILPVLGLLLLGVCIYGYFYWRRIRRALEKAQAPAEPQPEERREAPRKPSDEATYKLDTSGIGDAKEVEFTKE